MIDKAKPVETSNEVTPPNAIAKHTGDVALGHVFESVDKVVVKPPVPRGWTTLMHGTDSERWQLGERLKTIKRDGLAVISTRDAEQAQRFAANVGSPGAYDTTRNYAGASGTAKPVEVRILFLDDIFHYHRPGEEDLRAALTPRKKELLRTYYQPRHPVVPVGEHLMLVSSGTDEATGRFVEYFLPMSVETDYNTAVQLEARAARDNGTS